MRKRYDLESSALAAQAPQRAALVDRAEATNAVATITYNAIPTRRHCIRGVAWGFDDDPLATAFVEVVCGGVVNFRVPVTNGGAGIFENLTRRSAKGQNMLVRITAGGAGITGYINVENYWTEE